MSDFKTIIFCRRKILKDKNLSLIERRFLLFLLHHGTSLRAGILLHLNKFIGGISDVEMRATKARLIEKGYPVGSHNSRGYFWQFTQEDKSLGVSEYRSRAYTELGKANLLEKNFHTFYSLDSKPVQYSIFETEVVK